MSKHYDRLGIECPRGDDFYVCDGAAVEFIGCCTSDPCADGSGQCPTVDLRATSFNPDRYASIPPQDCDDSRGPKTWYTCRDNDPPFMGCCNANPCGPGCSQDDLLPAVLSADEVNRLAFVPEPESSAATSSTSTSSSMTTSTALASFTGTSTLTIPSPSSSEAADQAESAGLQTGAVVGIAVGAVAALGIIILLALRCGWFAAMCGSRSRRKAVQDDTPDVQQKVIQPDFQQAQPVPVISYQPPSYHSTPTSPAGTHHQANFSPTVSSPTSVYPSSAHSRYNNYPEHDAGFQRGHVRHSSQLSGASYYPSFPAVSEIDGVERSVPRVELAAEERK